MSRTYPGAPEYAEIPLTGDLSVGRGAPGRPAQDDCVMPRTEGLGPFPDDLYPAEVPQRPAPIPNNPLIAEKGLKVFSQWSELDVGGDPIPQTPNMNAYQMMRTPIPRSNRDDAREGEGTASMLWAIELWGYEVARVAPNAGLSPLSESAIINNNIEQGNQFTRLKARISMHGASGGSTRIFDIGAGVRMSIEAWQVSVEVLYPQPGTVQVDGREGLVLGAPNGGLVLDSVVGCFMAPTSSTPGGQVTTNTITTFVNLGTADQRIFIPPGARSVDLYQTGTGGAMTLEYRLLRSATVLGPTVGQVTLGANRRIQDAIIPKSAGMITTGPADGANNRVITAIFRGEI